MGSKFNQPTIKTVAKEAGVSVSTVSRVLNGNNKVDEKLHDKVMEAVNRLGYKPNLAARSIKGIQTNIIGCLVPDMTMSFFKDFLAGAVSESGKYGFNILAASSNSSLKEENKSLQNFSNSIIDGLIVIPISQINKAPSLSDFNNIPVLIGYRNGWYKNMPHISYNNEQGGYLATRYLLNLGRRNIAFIAGLYEEHLDKEELINYAKNGPLGRYSSIDRFRGYIKAYEEINEEINPNLLHLCGNSFEDGFITSKNIISENDDIDSLIAFNDTVAFGAISFLKSQKIKIPEDVSVIGYDDSPLANQIQPSLTSINQDAKKLGRMCVNATIDMINNKRVESKILDVYLNIKNSTCRK